MTGNSGDIGVGLVSVGWMGKLHSHAYRALPSVYPELGLRPRLVHAADTAADRVTYAREVLGYARGSGDYRDVLADPEVDVVSICAPNVLHHEIGLAAAEAGELGAVENDDYAAALVRLSPTADGPGAVGTLEASRTIVGPRCGLGFELYGP